MAYQQLGLVPAKMSVSTIPATDFGGTGFFWQVDPSFTYTRPMIRSDGLIVRRRNYVGYSAPGLLQADAFETLMARGQHLHWRRNS